MTLQQNSEEAVVKEDRRHGAWEVIFPLHIIDYRENILNVYNISGVSRQRTVVPPGCKNGTVANTWCHYLCPSHSYMDKMLP